MANSSRREQLLRQIIAWAESRADIKALGLVGSGARLDLPADEWSDIDLVLVAEDPSAYLGSDNWCAAIDEPWVGTLERGPGGQIVERRVLFRSGIDADFIVISSDLRALQTEALKSITARGMRILLDKDMLLCGLMGEERQAAVSPAPSCAEFTELVNDFWFHAVWTAKKMRRGELWTAKSCCDGYMKRLLLAMIEWHAQPSGTATWYSGRFIERWAGADVVARLGSVFAHYEEADIWRALIQTMELFAAISRGMAQRLGFAYPDEQARGISAWVKAKLGEI